MDELLRKFLIRLRLNKQTDCCILAPLTFHELSGGTLVQGWLYVGDSVCWHLWVQDADGTIYDPLAELSRERIGKYQFRWVTSEPPEYDKDPSIIEMYELYLKDPANFWKKQPKKFRDLRGKVFHQLRPKTS